MHQQDWAQGIQALRQQIAPQATALSLRQLPHIAHAQEDQSSASAGASRSLGVVGCQRGYHDAIHKEGPR